MSFVVEFYIRLLCFFYYLDNNFFFKPDISLDENHKFSFFTQGLSSGSLLLTIQELTHGMV
jgi:hypothetical protein